MFPIQAPPIVDESPVADHPLNELDSLWEVYLKAYATWQSDVGSMAYAANWNPDHIKFLIRKRTERDTALADYYIAFDADQHRRFTNAD